MIRSILLFLCLTNLDPVIGQSYQSIYGDSTTTWSIVKEGYCDFVCSAFYSPNGDTSINMNSYKILPDYGFIREDSVSGKVWFYEELWNQEFLVMDLSLNVSDDFTIFDWSGNPQQVIVDSIKMNGGKKHVYLNAIINICGTEEQLVFIEGSGPNAGFNYQRQASWSFLNSYMLCHSKNDLKVQGNLMFADSCDICSGVIDELDLSEKELLKVCDYLGRETSVKENIPLLFYYTDGTIKRVFIVDK